MNHRQQLIQELEQAPDDLTQTEEPIFYIEFRQQATVILWPSFQAF
ncbi:MAG: hypothetical protein O9326_16880 [Microcystis sp. LE19-338.1B]|jgi:hypothetical protein|nr:hypothetical protein [Microcystis sp. LE19-338.1B]MCZ8357011.1 hypothetical protein [Microcystis sp. LE19-388.1G]